MVMRQSTAVSLQLGSLFGAGTATGLDDGQLLERFIDSRDQAAFAALVARHGPLVLGACRHLLRDPADVEDAFQATFLVLIRKASSLRDRRLLGTWLYKVAYRVALRARSEAEGRFPHLFDDQCPAAAEDLERREFRAVVHEEIHRLPSRFRRPVELCYLEGLSHEQAAHRLSCPLGTVNSRLATARQRLKLRLVKRGLAPSGMLAVSMSLTKMVKAEVPDALLQATVLTARRFMIGSSVTVASSATVARLTEGFLRAMIASKIKMAVAGVLAAGLAVASLGLVTRGVHGAIRPEVKVGEQSRPHAAAARPDSTRPLEAAIGEDGTVLVIGTIRMPDRTKVAGATVEVMTDAGEKPILAHTDEAGRFELRGVFGNGCKIRASSADLKHQVLLNVSSAAVRTAFVSPIELTLMPAQTHAVIVVSDGRPVEGARVLSTGPGFQVRGVTGRDGKALLRFPPTEQIQSLVAWHRELGVEGVVIPERRTSQNVTRLALRPPGPHTIRVVDLQAKPIVGLELAVFLRMKNLDPIPTNRIEEAHVRTDAEGKATLAWMPRENPKFVGAEIVGSDWNVDEIDPKRLSEGITTIRARQRHENAVEGRLVMPEGASAEGLLITGFGFGPLRSSDAPYSQGQRDGTFTLARARRDGSFTLRIQSEYAYILGIDDAQWSCDSWSGTILGQDSGKPADVTMNVHPATPLSVRVTRGPKHLPVASAGILVSDMGEVTWLDDKGKKQSAGGGVIRRWIWTDAQGVARTGVGKGDHDVRLSSGDWTEERKFEAATDKPVAIEFHRPWSRERRITGRMMLDGARYTPSPTLLARAWTPQTDGLQLDFKPEIRPDGSFEVVFDAENLSILLHDPQRHRSGFVQTGREDASLEPKMLTTATYSGTLLDKNSQPVADRGLRLYAKTGDREALAATHTDKTGRFRFVDVPANVPLRLTIQNEDEFEDSEYFQVDGDRLFNPGENRENDQVRPPRTGVAGSAARPTALLGARVESTCGDVRSSGMHALIVLQGDSSENVINLSDRLLDDEEVKAVLKYRPMRVDAGQVESEQKALADFGWPKPAPGEIVLIALNGTGTTLAAKRIATSKLDESMKLGAGFLKEHAPPTRDAFAMLATARREAEKSGRRVWIVIGGPRCGPCFMLGRWMDDHHTTLEKDYVVVKAMDGVDEQVAQVIETLPMKETSIPWFAITEPDGTVLQTSKGPLRNIGFPGSVEDLRHFRQMLERTARRLKSDDVDGLIKSLLPR